MLSLWILVAGIAHAAEGFHLKSVYSRGNDDLDEANHETAKITVELVVRDSPPNHLTAEISYLALFSVDHPHNPMGDRFHLKQRINDIEPNLTSVKFTYTPGPDGTSLGGTVQGKLFLGEFPATRVGPVRGRIAVTTEPDFEPNQLTPVDSTLDWGFLMKDGQPQLGELSLHAQWKGTTRPSDEMLRLIDSSFVDKSSFRPPFPAATKAFGEHLLTSEVPQSSALESRPLLRDLPMLSISPLR